MYKKCKILIIFCILMVSCANTSINIKKEPDFSLSNVLKFRMGKVEDKSGNASTYFLTSTESYVKSALKKRNLLAKEDDQYTHEVIISITKYQLSSDPSGLESGLVGKPFSKEIVDSKIIVIDAETNEIIGEATVTTSYIRNLDMLSIKHGEEMTNFLLNR